MFFKFNIKESSYLIQSSIEASGVSPISTNDKDDAALESLCVGRSVKSNWCEINLDWEIDEDVVFKNYDIVFYLGYLPMCSERIMKILKEKVNDNEVEFLPVLIQKKKYFCINVLQKLSGVLNRRKSEISYFEDGRVMWVDKYVIMNSKIKTLIFMIEESETSIFVTEVIKDVLEEAKATGIEFQKC